MIKTDNLNLFTKKKVNVNLFSLEKLFLFQQQQRKNLSVKKRYFSYLAFL